MDSLPRAHWASFTHSRVHTFADVCGDTGELLVTLGQRDRLQKIVGRREPAAHGVHDATHHSERLFVARETLVPSSQIAISSPPVRATTSPALTTAAMRWPIAGRRHRACSRAAR